MNRLELRHILCPIDLSGEFGSSLSCAMAMARARRAELRTVHVVPTEGPAPPRDIDSLRHEMLMQQLRESLADADPEHDLVGAAVRQGDPGVQILDFARAISADLIVMGAPGADRPERPLGPVASVVIARSDCPVLAVPAHPSAPIDQTGFFNRIVCAVDLAPSSAGVIRQALSLAWESAARLTLACVLSEDGREQIPYAEKALLAAVPSEAKEWCETDVVVATGASSAEIVRIAEERHADLVVIGAPRRWTSTTHAVLSRSVCPVLVTHDARPLPWPAGRSTQARGIL
jgi:nucleotide-binding universal stress UspA family protein